MFGKLNLPIHVGKRYRRRNGEEATCVAFEENSRLYGEVAYLDRGLTVWRQSGQASETYESADDIIEEWKDEMKIEAGKWYKTRNGHKAYIGFIVPPEGLVSAPVQGYIATDNIVSHFRGWGIDGRTGVESSRGESTYDLIEEWKEPVKGEIWLNVYGTNNIVYHATKEDALNSCPPWNKPIARVKASWVEGQFDE